jgi:hypothetical protein
MRRILCNLGNDAVDLSMRRGYGEHIDTRTVLGEVLDALQLSIGEHCETYQGVKCRTIGLWSNTRTQNS